MLKTSASAVSINRMFRAFSDRSRLRILCLLKDNREMCVGDLMTILGLPQPRTSRHLAYLRKSGLVKVRRAEQWNYYSLAPPQTSFHEKLLECLGCCFQDVPEIRADRIRAKKLKKSGGCCPAD